MKTRPILFNAEMVRAILDGSKTQTRRDVKPQPDTAHGGEPYWNIGGYRGWANRGVTDVLRMGTNNPIVCPFGSVGDQLYVHETWAAPADSDGTKPSLMPEKTPVIYAASRGKGALSGVWRPSIHMPKWASRITLEIVGVRIERLNTISEADAIAEGLRWSGELDGQVLYTMVNRPLDPGVIRQSFRPSGLPAVECFARLFESIYGAESFDDRWVWVIEFKRVES